MTISFIDHLMQELEGRLSSNAKVATLGFCLVSSVMSKMDDWQSIVYASLYHVYFPAPLSLQTDLRTDSYTVILISYKIAQQVLKMNVTTGSFPMFLPY